MNARGNAKKFREMTDAQYIERLKSKCSTDGRGCWIFQGPRSWKGYGQTSYRGRKWSAHRLSYFLHKGEIPVGKMVCHTCDVRSCCNPDHLWIGSNDENQLDAWNKGRKRMQSATHCERGHEYTPETTRRYGKAARRTCLICQRARNRIRAGWPTDLAYTADAVPNGYIVVGAKWPRTTTL